MDQQRDEALYRRIEKLEASVRELQLLVDEAISPASNLPPRSAPGAVRKPATEVYALTRPLDAASPPGSSTVAASPSTRSAGSTSTGPRMDPSPSTGPSVDPSPSTGPSVSVADRLKALFAGNSEALLNRLGIGLLLLGVGFLFKYSVDQGWITETVRVAFGAGLGVYLLITGVRIAPRRPRLAAVLNGGGVAILYGSIFAAFALYHLIGAPTAFNYMVGVTVLGFLLSVYQREEPLTVIATIGGLATPFLVPAENPDLIGLSAYVSLIVIGATATYMHREWRLPLFTAAAGAALVLLLGHAATSSGGEVTGLERLAFQAGIIVYWMAFGWCPVLRELLREQAPKRDAPPDLTIASGTGFMRRPALSLSVLTPLVVLVLFQVVSPWPAAVTGWLSVALAAAYAAASVALERRSFPTQRAEPIEQNRRPNLLVQRHRLAAAALLTVGLFVLWDRPWLVPVLALEAVVIDLASRKLRDAALGTVGSLLFLASMLLFLEHVASRGSQVVPALVPVFNVAALAGLASIAAYAVYALTLESGPLKRSLLLAAHVLFLVWMLSEFGALAAGEGIATIGWISYAVILFVLGLHRRIDAVRLAGLLTILASVGKLLVFDLAALDPLWRILLFLGFGGVLLLLSYYMPDLWKTSRTDHHETVEAGADHR